VSPEVLAGLETLAAVKTLERSGGGVDPLVKAHGRRVFEALSADAALARVLLAVPVQIVLLEVHLQLETDVADTAAVRPNLSMNLEQSKLVVNLYRAWHILCNTCNALNVLVYSENKRVLSSGW